MCRQMKVDQEKHQKTRALFERLLQKTGVKEEDLAAEGFVGKEGPRPRAQLRPEQPHHADTR